MIRPDDPTAMPAFEIEPVRSPLFQLLQPQVGSDKWMEVGYVWVYGTSRTNCTECWYLYDSAPAGTSFAAYTWPGYDATGKLLGTALRLVPATPPAGQDPTTMKGYLEKTNGVTVNYVVGTMSQGR